MDMGGTKFEAIATAGDVHLGGMDWDGRIMDHLAEQFQKEHGVDPREDESSRMKLLHLSSRAKKTLTARDKAQVRFGMGGVKSTLEITREEFESLTEDLVERTRLTVRRMLKDSVIEWSEVTRLLLVGGSTRMPMIQRMLETESGLKCDRSLSPDEAVAHGAAVYANTKMERGSPPVSIANVNSHDLGVLGRDPATKKTIHQVMIARNSRLPQTKKRKFVTSKEGQKEVVVTVVEGGTDSGAGATRIGKCRVADLPANLPKGTSVNVTFQYSTDGRLVVDAEVPSAGINALTTIQRSSGMTESDLEFWTAKIAEGVKIDTDQFPEAVTKSEPKSPPKKVAQAGATAPQSAKPTNTPSPTPVLTPVFSEALFASADSAPTPQPKGKPASPPEVPMVPLFEEPTATVEQSKIIVGEGGGQPAVGNVEVIPEIAFEEKSVSKVEESRIIVNNEAQPKKQIDDDGLGDFLKNL